MTAGALTQHGGKRRPDPARPGPGSAADRRRDSVGADCQCGPRGAAAGRAPVAARALVEMRASDASPKLKEESRAMKSGEVKSEESEGRGKEQDDREDK